MMSKKELKFYEAPACEVMELDAKIPLLAGSGDPDDVEDDPNKEPIFG